jgi:hypothetical protein
MEAPASNRESLEFMKRISRQNPGMYRHRFVFMHIPPSVSDDFQARGLRESDEFIRIFEKLRVDCVFTGDYHGYARIQRGATSYLLTGGGGAHLDGGRGKQFHHAVMIHVAGKGFSKRIIAVDRQSDAGAALMRFAIVMFLPWVSSHTLEAVGINMLASLGLLFLLIHLNRLRPPHG